MARRTRGFTLIELSVSLAIAGLLLAVAIPGLSRLYARVQFNARLDDLESGITAMSRVAYALGEEGSLAAMIDRHLVLPADWTLAGAEDIYVRSSGLCAGGTLRVITPGGERELVLQPPFCAVERHQ
jgi:prepilin-type N-terminal cleavage/methylation domain-containing protein